VLDLRFVPLFLIEHPIITFNSKSPKSDAMEEVPNFDLLGKPLKDPFPIKGFLPMEAIIVTSLEPT
jgi:hypothetical protein